MGGVLSWLGLTGNTAVAEATQRAVAAESMVEIANETARQAVAATLTESMTSLELTLEDEGWQRLTMSAGQQFSREGLRRAAEIARVMAIANPWIKRGLGLRAAYVWGQGVEISARANGKDTGQDVNAVVQAFLDDEGNKRTLTGDQAHTEVERALGTDGNVFVACFTNPRTGYVQVRSLPFDEIVDIVSNPDDRDEPWFYRREWDERKVMAEGGATRLTKVHRVAFYPALTFRPSVRPKRINDVEVVWDAPVLHVDVNGLDGWAFGIGDAFAALPFARMYRDFLGDWATLMRSLSQFAWRLTSKGSKAQDARAKIARRTTAAAPAGNPNTVGATVVTPSDVQLEAIPKSGATLDSDSGRPLGAAIAAAIGVPVTILLGDPGTTGARAVAETLDKPTRLEMQTRQALWRDAFEQLLAYVVLQAVKAPAGPLRGQVARDEITGREVVIFTDDTDPTIEIVFPPLEDTDPAVIIKAIVEADSTRKLPPLEVAKLLLQALGVKDVDDLLADMQDEDGRWIDPYGELGSVGQAAIDAFRRGQDPASAAGMNAGAEDEEPAER